MFAGKRVVFCAGTWDLFHIGHLEMIRKARQHAADGILIVGVTTDEHTEEYKGVKPFVPYGERFRIIQALKFPDLVVPQTKQFDIEHMRELNVDEVVLGTDWAEKMPDHLKAMMKHVRVYFEPRTEGISTSGIKHKMKEL